MQAVTTNMKAFQSEANRLLANRSEGGEGLQVNKFEQVQGEGMGTLCYLSHGDPLLLNRQTDNI